MTTFSRKPVELMSKSLQEIDRRTSEPKFRARLAHSLGLERSEAEAQASTRAAWQRLQRRIEQQRDGHTG